ncbi:MAG: hypothetical protein K6B46_03910 [Opitutales bacterium]|nr:hypothetical protein [Opitutales bacterium]
MKKIIALLLTLTAPLFIFACFSKPIPKHSIEVWLEAPSRSSSFGLHEKIVMPVSGITAYVTRPVVAGIDAFTNADLLIQDDPLTGLSVPGVRLRLKDDAWMNVYQMSSAALATAKKRGEIKRLFLVVDGHPIGYCKIIRPIRRDDLFFYIESNKKDPKDIDAELRDLRFNLNEYILDWREYKQEK